QSAAVPARPSAALGEELPQLARRFRAPAVFVQRIKGEIPVEGAPGSTVLGLDVPAPEGSSGRTDGRPREVAAVLGVYGERAAQRVEPEDRIRARDDVDPGDGQLRGEVPPHRVAESVVEAHAVEVDRQADGTAGQRRGQ